jgi:hypothetical protein
MVAHLACVFTTLELNAVDWVWIEGENAVSSSMNRHPWWYDQVKKEQFSGGDFISNFSKEKAGEAEYRFKVEKAGDCEFWLRVNPTLSRLFYSLNGASEQEVDMTHEKRGEVNVAADDKPDLRFLAWVKGRTVALRTGENTIRFRMAGERENHGYLDCFVLSREPFVPRGLLKPDQMAEELKALSAEQKSWHPFDPPADDFGSECAIDLRFLNEEAAGQGGFIGAKDGQFIHTSTGKPVRFWAVNGPPHELKGDALRHCARMLAKRGVNMVRLHGGVFRRDGQVDREKVRHILEIVSAMKAEGIYSHLSIYFPLWIQPKADTPWLKGYDGQKHPFAALFFNPDFQQVYRSWWEALLSTRDPATGKTLVEEPALAGLEMQNEDSFFFWTFTERNLPEPQLQLLEKLFGDWLAKRHGSVAAALEKWNAPCLKRDAPEQGRAAFRELWAMFSQKTLRDQETAQFLFELQTEFYTRTHDFLRKLGFKGVVTASNWATASPEVFGPMEKLSYVIGGDFVDRHGYFSCNHKGEAAEWSIRNGHTYSDRSALRFDAEVPGKSKLFAHPAMDPQYNDHPSMLSESTWNRPNRFRSEAPLYFAVYGALQDSDAIVHFALDGAGWQVKPNFWMQPWTLMSPAMMGQFPAAALIYRQGLVSTGKTLARVKLNKRDLLALKGTPLPQDASLDELRLKDLPGGTEFQAGGRIDPLIHYAGRAKVLFTDEPTTVEMEDLSKMIDHTHGVVTSSTEELVLDYRRGLLVINAPKAQGISSAAAGALRVETKDFVFQPEMELAHIVAAPLDGQPLGASKRILLQVMSEEQTSGFQTEPAEGGLKRITSIGTDPWQIKEIKGNITCKRADADRMTITTLDHNGYRKETVGTSNSFRLRPSTIYYLLSF